MIQGKETSKKTNFNKKFRVNTNNKFRIFERLIA